MGLFDKYGRCNYERDDIKSCLNNIHSEIIKLLNDLKSEGHSPVEIKAMSSVIECTVGAAISEISIKHMIEIRKSESN